MYFLYFVIISLWKRADPFTQVYFVPTLLEIVAVVLAWQEDENDRRTDGQTDRRTTENMWSEKLTWAFSSGELKNLRWVTVYYSQTIVLWNFDLIWCKLCKFDLHYEKNYGTIPTRSRGPWATSLAWVSLKQ